MDTGFTSNIVCEATGHAEHPAKLTREQAEHLGYIYRQCGAAERHDPHPIYTIYAAVSFYCPGGQQ